MIFQARDKILTLLIFRCHFLSSNNSLARTFDSLTWFLFFSKNLGKSTKSAVTSAWSDKGSEIIGHRWTRGLMKSDVWCSAIFVEIQGLYSHFLNTKVNQQNKPARFPPLSFINLPMGHFCSIWKTWIECQKSLENPIV